MATIISRPNDALYQTETTPVNGVTTGAGTIDRGASSIGFLNSGAGSAIINGFPLPSGASHTMLQSPGRPLGEIAVDATGTTLEISAMY